MSADHPVRQRFGTNMMQSNTAVFWRHDTFLGVCEAIGQDFGFNANWLRIIFSVALLVSPKVVLSVYLGLGLVVLASRLLFPVRAAAAANTGPIAPRADNDAAAAELPIAA